MRKYWSKRNAPELHIVDINTPYITVMNDNLETFIRKWNFVDGDAYITYKGHKYYFSEIKTA